MMDGLTRKMVLDMIAGRMSVYQVVTGVSIIGLTCEKRQGKPDDPLALALIDYLATGNFASLAVVLDEEASRIDKEMNKPITGGDLIDSGYVLEVTSDGSRRIAYHRDDPKRMMFESDDQDLWSPILIGRLRTTKRLFSVIRDC